MSTITRFSVPARTSGRDLTAVRRPKPPLDIASLRKPELVALAESRGLDSSGNVADLRERLADG